jgi:predicted nucleotidyltransferase
MNDFLTSFIARCEDILRENLICILLLGSVQKGDTTPFSDIDLVAIIKRWDGEQLKKIRRLVRRESEQLIDFTFLCWDEISKDPARFRVGTHGCYQLELILKKAECLVGSNVLLDLPSPVQDDIRLSILDKILQYTWWARRLFVESNREHSIESNYQLNSRLIKMIKGFMYLAGSTDIHQNSQATIEKFLKNYSHLLSEEEKLTARGLVDKKSISKNASNMSEKYLERRLSIINKIHKEAIRLFNQKPAT